MPTANTGGNPLASSAAAVEVSPPSDSTTTPATARPRYRSRTARSAAPSSLRRAVAVRESAVAGASSSPNDSTSVWKRADSAGPSSVFSSSRARSIRRAPSASSIAMLRDVSTRMGTTASDAPSGAALNTGRMTSTSKRMNVTRRSALSA